MKKNKKDKTTEEFEKLIKQNKELLKILLKETNKK